MSENRAFDFKSGAESKLMAVYRYENEAGDLVFEKLRYCPKAFRLRRWANGRVIYNLRGVEPVPYRLPKWKDAPTVVVSEGEKDADILADLGFVSTSGPFGAISWPTELTPKFKDKQVFICYDIGEEKAAGYVAASLYGTAREIRICRLPLMEYEADVTDYINQVPPSDHQRAQQIKLVQDLLKNAELYQPPEVVTDNPTVLSEPEGEAIKERAAIMEVDGGLRRAEAEVEARKDPHSQEATPDESLDIKNDFLNMWTDSITQITDASRTLILFAGVGLLSALLHKSYFYAPKETHLNLYLFILGPSSLPRKTTILDIVNDYLVEVEPELALPDEFTAESLQACLSKRNHGVIFWRELNRTLDQLLGVDYNRGLSSTLSDIYDHRKLFVRYTKKDGMVSVTDPVVTIIGAGVDEYLVSHLKELDFISGLWPRVTLVRETSRKTKEYRLPGRFTPQRHILKSLGEIASVRGGEISFDKIKPEFIAFAQNLQREVEKLNNKNLTASFLRLEWILIKIAAILQLADHPDSKYIKPEAFNDAVTLINYLKQQLPEFYGDHFRTGNEFKIAACVLRYIQKKEKGKGYVLYSNILRTMSCDTKVLKAALERLLGTEEIEETDIPTTKLGGRIGKGYRSIQKHE